MLEISSASDFHPSAEEEAEARPLSVMSSPRKRRRAPEQSTRNVKRDFRNLYNDSYRELLNEEITDAAARFDPDRSSTSSKYLPPSQQIGVSAWSLEEKSIFFAALERLGRDDVSGIAKAIKSKTIPEVQELLLLLHDAALAQRDSKLTLRDCPAAFEISVPCSESLELAGDALAALQERFEASEEEARFGQYWLITPIIAEELEIAVASVTAPTSSSTPAPTLDDEEHLDGAQRDDISKPEILLHVPESELLKISTLLELSKRFFMNTGPILNSSFPHWSSLASPLASEPSIYRTALKDFHTLAVSLTRRLVQVCLIQATSRIRAQDWRTKNRVTPLVKSRDIFTAIDILGLPRTRSRQWKSMARRCGLRVYDGEGKDRKDLEWKEVEESLDTYQRFGDYYDSEASVSRHTSADVEPESRHQNFRGRAMRSGTPLPDGRFIELSSDFNDVSGSDIEFDTKVSEAEGSTADDMSQMSISSIMAKKEEDIDSAMMLTLEEFDAEAGRAEELRLWSMLGSSPPPSKLSREVDDDAVKTNEEMDETLVTDVNDWHDRIEYRAAWETLRRPVPVAALQANQRLPPAMSDLVEEMADAEADLNESSEDGGSKTPRRRRKTEELDIPLRGARAYAALQEKLTPLEHKQDTDESESEFAIPLEDAPRLTKHIENNNIPVRSIEQDIYDPFEGEFAPFQSDYSMDS